MSDQEKYDLMTRAVKSALRDCLRNMARIAPENEESVPHIVRMRWPSPEEAQRIVQNEIDYLLSTRGYTQEEQEP